MSNYPEITFVHKPRFTSRPFPASPHHRHSPNIQSCPMCCNVSSLSTSSEFSNSPPRQTLSDAALLSKLLFSVFAHRRGGQVSSAPVRAESPDLGPLVRDAHRQITCRRVWRSAGRSPIFLCSGINIYIHSEQQICFPNSLDRDPK